MTRAQEELAKLRSFAARRLANPHGVQLCGYLDGAPWEPAVADRPLVPWEMSLGFHTPHWAGFSEEAQLALNHWTYAMMYFRITDGERFVVTTNTAVADSVAEQEPWLADLLRLETAEERDHIAAFSRTCAAVHRRHGLEGVKLPVKALRPLLVSRPMLRLLTRVFGADFVVAYFLGRGFVNHMGKAYEMGIARCDDVDASLRKLSLLHTVDENRHMAVSRMMAACTYELLHERRNRSAAYAALNEALQATMLRYTFSDRITTGQERAMSRRALFAMRTLADVPRDVLADTIDAHFAGVTGIETAKNAFVPRFNQRLLDSAGLTDEEKLTWFELLVSLQRNLVFFPAGYRPGLPAGEAAAFDDVVVSRAGELEVT